MDLFALKGNALKVYLKLLEGRDAQGVCSLSQRTLGRQLDLHRETVAHALGQLERLGLIEGRDPGWSVCPQLLADYLQRSGWKNQPLLPVNGRKNQPLLPVNGRKNRPFALSPDDPLTRARTSRSSSYEEDSTCTAVPPSSLPPFPHPPGEGRGKEGGENIPEEEKEKKIPPSEYLSEMQSWWDDIWPDNLEEDHPWFGQLWEEFGTEIPLSVLEQFVQAGKSLEDLQCPTSYKRYFHTCCRNAPKQRPILRKPPPCDADYDQDLKALYLADQEGRDSEFDDAGEKLKALYLADHDDTAYDDYEQKLRAP